ncbi:sigma 54-interacting transcriptional regulator [Solibacillus sp. MA9]|uniref:Sigma 54-interacting transcriptional regulator n=1 Tax=Solibacillus palustris TaxID=2908203 RepID=A0ABS9UAA8_9BACL|nr:sigma 54-interacting transcriptional regulator [Solibacillus sp. MA9]MCH7321261.1 sigma 54-interacting transcriptional regulator [Solibacillus sp. MA9]
MSENNLQKMNLIYQGIIEQLDVGIHAVDEAGKTLIYNRKMCEMESMKKEDVLGKKIQDVFKFQENQESTLLHSLQNKKEILNVKQTYFNNRGIEITTVNKTLPIQENRQMVAAVEIATDVTKMEKLMRANKRTNDANLSFTQIIGQSGPLIEVIELAKRATRTNSNVLIVGETGTGKELFAQSIHHESDRATKPFVSQNCAALPDSLIESILFGTVRGAFTGALDSPGLFEQAQGGTLLLDELNSLNITLQAKLLRVIQEKKVRRLGATKEIDVDVRIIATMNEDPVDAIASGKLRKDLYFRLAVITVMVPALRERIDDLPVLLDYFISQYNQLFSMNVDGVSDEVFALFAAHNWPGNIRELEHAIEAAMNLMHHEREIMYEHLPYHYRKGDKGQHKLRPLKKNYSGQLLDQLAQFEQQVIEDTLRQNDNHITNSAQQLGLSRQSLQYRMKRLQIRGGE